MRTWGRIPAIIDGQQYWPESPWVEVSTDANGENGYVYLTTLCQALKLNLGESPFYGDLGIPAVPSVITQIAPDYYVNSIQQRFSQYFASLTIAKTASLPPTYQINAVFLDGTVAQMSVVPQ